MKRIILLFKFLRQESNGNGIMGIKSHNIIKWTTQRLYLHTHGTHLNFQIALRNTKDELKYWKSFFRYPLGTLFSRQHAQYTDIIHTMHTMHKGGIK